MVDDDFADSSNNDDDGCVNNDANDCHDNDAEIVMIMMLMIMMTMMTLVLIVVPMVTPIHNDNKMMTKGNGKSESSFSDKCPTHQHVKARQ